jgi:hypothetical protein
LEENENEDNEDGSEDGLNRDIDDEILNNDQVNKPKKEKKQKQNGSDIH